MFEYPSRIYNIVDGDTVDAVLDLGFKVQTRQRIRLWGINTPESRTRALEETKRVKAATAGLTELLAAVDNQCVVTSKEYGKYGRCLGILWVPLSEIEPLLEDWKSSILDQPTLNEDSEFETGDSAISLNQLLVKEGHAVEYHGGKR